MSSNSKVLGSRQHGSIFGRVKWAVIFTSAMHGTQVAYLLVGCTIDLVGFKVIFRFGSFNALASK